MRGIRMLALALAMGLIFGGAQMAVMAQEPEEEGPSAEALRGMIEQLKEGGEQPSIEIPSESGEERGSRALERLEKLEILPPPPKETSSFAGGGGGGFAPPPPENNLPEVEVFGPDEVTWGGAAASQGTYTVVAKDQDTSDTLTVTPEAPKELLKQVSISGTTSPVTATYTFTPAKEQGYVLVFSVSDGKSKVSATKGVGVGRAEPPDNNPPQISVSAFPTTVTPGQKATIQVTAWDPDKGDSFTVRPETNWGLLNPAPNAGPGGQGQKRYNYVFQTTRPGSYDKKFFVTDSRGQTADGSVSITVEAKTATAAGGGTGSGGDPEPIEIDIEATLISHNVDGSSYDGRKYTRRFCAVDLMWSSGGVGGFTVNIEVQSAYTYPRSAPAYDQQSKKYFRNLQPSIAWKRLVIICKGFPNTGGVERLCFRATGKNVESNKSCTSPFVGR